MKEQASVWWDFWHGPKGQVEVGIECSDKSLTFDGHYICLVPKHKDEIDSSGAIARAEILLSYLRGQKQMRREP
jgi:hypothetical protein